MAQCELAEVIHRSVAPRPTTLKQLLLDSASRFPERIAVVALHQAADLYPTISTGDGSANYLRWTYSELMKGARLLAASLRSHGIRRGDPIASLQLNGADWALAFWAAALLECPWVAIQPRTATNPEEVRHLMDLSKPRVLLASNVEHVEQLRENLPARTLESMVKICPVTLGGDLKGWSSIDPMLELSRDYRDLGTDSCLDGDDDLALVLFTSGTTGQPKGCMHTQRSVTSIFRNHAHGLNVQETSSSISHLTLSHCFGMLYSGSFWTKGAKVVYASWTFDAKSTLKALELEQCTHMPAVPSLLYSLLDCVTEPCKSLRHTEFSGAMVPSGTVAHAKERLGAGKVSSHFGMTESGPAALWPYDQIPDSTTAGEFVSPGLPVSGGMLKICAPGTTTPLGRGEPGEIHQCSPHVIKAYLGGVATEQFYEDDSGRWMITGDQGVMLETGEIRVSGRYKDIIIRGGGNIAPAQMEAVLNVRDHIKVQVVGASDEMLGEVPVAVYQGAESEEDAAFVKSMQSLILQQLGPSFALDQVVSIRELGLLDFPQTTSGKVRKIELADAVKAYRHCPSRCDSANDCVEQIKVDAPTFPCDTIEERVISVWAQVLGLGKSEISPETSISAIADSLTMMQARRLFRKNGLEVSVQHLLEHPTIAAQIELLSGPRSPALSIPELSHVREGPPEAFDMIEAFGDEAGAQKVQYCATPVLARYGLTWREDVEDVVPMYDLLANMAAVKRRTRSAMRRDAFWVRGVDSTQLRKLLWQALAHHSALRSVWFPTSATSVSQAIIRSTDKASDTFIRPGAESVETSEDLATVWAGDDSLDLCDAQRGPGALFNAAVFDIDNKPGSSGLVYWTNHAAFDATSLSYFHETLDELLEGRPVTERTSYKLWADSYHTGRNGPQALAGAKELGRRLKGLAEYSGKSVVPQPKAPAYLEGDDSGWLDLTTGKPGDRSLRTPLDGENGMAIANRGLTRQCNLPGLQTLRLKHHIAVHTALKAALALVNTDWTGSKTAFFRSLQSGRKWPFIDPKLASHLPSAVDVAGPTLQASVNVVHFDHTETVGEFMRRMKADQDIANRYEHTPLALALAQLSEADRNTLMVHGLSQLFNYVPNNRGLAFAKLIRVQDEMNADTGLHWDFTHMGGGNVEIFVRWDGCHLRKVEVEAMLDDVEKVLAWVSEPEHWDVNLDERPRENSYRVDTL